MRAASLKLVSIAAVLAVLLPAAPAAARLRAPDWAKPAVRYLVNQGWIDKTQFRGDAPMARRDFKRLMQAAFGGGYRRTRGKVTAGEVSAALVSVLGRSDLAARLTTVTSPDGWAPGVGVRFGTEVVARELGLRHDRPTDQEGLEASASEPLPQADVAWAVWKAATSPATYSADTLNGFSLPDLGRKQRKVVKFAMSLTGTPYIWGGDWPARTPAGYPFGSQPSGGFDCSGFLWYVLQAKTSSYSPIDRPYKGWSLPERSSADMAKATPRKQRLGFRKLRAGDIVLFAPGGRSRARARDVYHAGLYLGRGWMIHSSGSRAGISLADISPGTWWHGEIMWGRRVIS